MDDQPRAGPGPGQPSTPGSSSAPPDPSFLWPALDRIRAVALVLLAHWLVVSCDWERKIGPEKLTV